MRLRTIPRTELVGAGALQRRTRAASSALSLSAAAICGTVAVWQVEAPWAQSLLILGIVLAALEGVLPTVGVELAAGATCVLGALLSIAWDDAGMNPRRVVLVLLPAAGAAVFGATGLMLLAGLLFGASGGAAAAAIADVPATPEPGQVGVARTPLKPSGRADFDGHLVDAQSQDGYIEAGAPVVAVRWNAKTLLVRAAQAPPLR